MKKRWMVFSLTLCVAAAAALGYSLYRLGVEEKSAKALARWEETVEARLLGDWGEPFVNEAAEALFAQPKSADISNELAVYTSPEGIRFRSMSQAWDESKLEALYQELLRNQHGQELYTLSQVVVYPQADDTAAACHREMGQGYRLTLRFPSLPERDIFTFHRVGGGITLYDGDRLTTPEEMASSLSHEYGHHFTFYYMFGQENGKPVYEGSEYARLRDLPSEQVRADAYSASDYLENHAWYFYEIAAEDYVVLMGSPNSRDMADYYDAREALNGRDDALRICRNAQVQENLMIPMANTVPGLADYFYGCLGADAPTYAPRDIEIQLERSVVGYDLADGYRSFVSYEITWNKAYGEDAVYTLVCFDPENYRDSFHPIRTVTAGEDARGEIGSLTKNLGSKIAWIDDQLAQGTRTFAVTVILPDGTMYCSELLEYTF